MEKTETCHFSVFFFLFDNDRGKSCDPERKYSQP